MTHLIALEYPNLPSFALPSLTISDMKFMSEFDLSKDVSWISTILTEHTGNYQTLRTVMRRFQGRHRQKHARVRNGF